MLTPDSPDFRAPLPDEPTGARVGAPSKAAGGPPAVAASLRATLEEAGVVRGAAALRAVNQRGGFDCASCAWPDPDGHRSSFEFCENGAKAVAEEATTRRVNAAFFARWSIPELASKTEHWLGDQGRLTEPMVRRAGSSHYEPVSWDEAFALAARELRALPSPDQAIFYTSGRASNEAAFLYQLLARRLGTNNLPDCSNMCHESSGFALMETIGIGKGTVTLADFDRADAIFVLGQNPGTNHPRMLTALQRAARRGAKIVSINPLPEPGLAAFRHPQELAGWVGPATPLACLHLPVRINGDVALLKGLMKEVLAAERAAPGTVLDHAFIRDFTDGFESLAAELDATSWEAVVEGSGLARDQIRAAAKVYLEADSVIACWAMGLTQHRNAVGTIREVVNWLLLRGNLGRPGAGVCPVRGHSNVQGDRTMGIFERPAPAFLDRLEATFGFAPPRHHGLDTVGAIAAMRDRRAKVFVALGGNFLSATPDTPVVAGALAACRLTVHVATKLNRSHVTPGEISLLLPCLARSDRDVQASGPQFVTTENSMGIVAPSHGGLAPLSPQMKSEPAIVAGLGEALFGNAPPLDWAAFAADYDRIREGIALVAFGCEGYNRKVRADAPFYLPNGPRDSRTFHTASGKAHFTSNPIPRWELADDELLLMTIRSHDQFNTTIYGLDDRYRGVKGGRRVVFLNADDAAARGLVGGDRVHLRSRFEGKVREVRDFQVVPFAIPPGCAAAYFPEANPLVPLESFAEGSRTPTSKSVVVTVHRPEPGARGLTIFS